MIKFLINRPIAVFMAFTACFILGVITYLNIPVSLLPDIAIPEISVHISGKDYSARELENVAVSSIRGQLLQVGQLRDIHSETRDGNAVIRLYFEYGTDTDLAFIEVNEKIDATMGYIPREIDRPRVVKASATDIPVFNLNLTLRNEQFTENDFLDLSQFAETVIKRRIEQLPQVSMVDMTGIMHKQILITPDENKIQIAGITLSDIETALSNNNVEPGSMTVREGYYEYNIKFSSVMRTLEDMQNIYLHKNEKIYQLKDLAIIEMLPEKETGLSFYNGKRSVVLSVIKQSDENMDNLKTALNKVITHFESTYPNIAFDISQNQTELLDYTISNLQQNLILAFVFILIVSALFMHDIRSPLVIGISMFVSLIISLLFFYLFKVSLNIISLTGLILALGMMIDNSIIVTDNISQYRQSGYPLDEACVRGTNEVITPMLSSVLTTISVFVPLIFLSGIAGALFFDQAFSVAVGLLVSYITGIILLPVLYKLIYSLKPLGKGQKNKQHTISIQKQKTPVHERAYHACINWIFSHKALTVIMIVAIFPLCAWLFHIIKKEKMPELSQNELIVTIDWNQNIHLDENKQRILNLLDTLNTQVTESSILIGQQQFLLNREHNKGVSESEIYLKTQDYKSIDKLKQTVENYFKHHYPLAIISFSPAMTVFEQIFNTAEANLTAEYYIRNRELNLTPQLIHDMQHCIYNNTGEFPTSISFQEQLNLSIDKQKLMLYGVSQNDVYQTVKTSFRENKFSVLRSYQQYLPIVLGGKEKELNDIINNSFVHTAGSSNGKRNTAPLSTFVNLYSAQDMKTIVAGKNGEYIPFHFHETQQPEKIIGKVKETMLNDTNWDVGFSGSFFSNRKMLNELLVILLISILLMYFILAAQFESFVQPFIVLLEIPVDIAAALGLLIILGHSLNLMSAIGIIVTCGIVINDSILKIDIMNQLRKDGLPLMQAIHEAGRRRLNAILMTSLTTIVCMLPLLFSHDMGSELEKPLAIATIGGMVIGTLVSLFVVPLFYWWIYKEKNN
ncbi:efflux RND transporter permease subunit [Paludibacter sp. 221]|uniref:efflux RND transporter permease subunit n=1 Tax=Paludibacter sp. 221 TaxID=2302939 RepID=UPI0013D48B3F|nr:efflux RND transporter permease subunit [Paludibacter sp. 221]NDV46521.1 efflux RND transporter permease subunit [Paludibacter sp. 221]